MQLVLNKCLLEWIFFSPTELSLQDVTLNEPARLKVFFNSLFKCFWFWLCVWVCALECGVHGGQELRTFF